MEGDISEMLRQIMGNPQFGSMVQAVKAQMGGEGDSMPDPAKIMEKMPEMMAALGPLLSSSGAREKGQQDEPERAEESEKQEGTQASSPSAEKENAASDREPDRVAENGLPPVMQQFFRPGSREKRNRLLSALKPYLSPARCILIDRAMSAMQMGELLGTVMPQDKGR